MTYLDKLSQILNKYNDWKANVIGDELREKYLLSIKIVLGFLKHKCFKDF